MYGSGGKPPSQIRKTTNRLKIGDILVTVALLSLSTLNGAFASTGTAEISSVLVTHQGDSITVFARVVNCFTRQMEVAILAGVPTTFTFTVDLYRGRNYWYDVKVTGMSVSNTIKYDSLKRIFYVSSSDRSDTTVFYDLESAKGAMSEFSAQLHLPPDRVSKGSPHYLMMKAKLDKVRLPLYLEYVFFFVSLWDFETAWYRHPLEF